MIIEHVDGVETLAAILPLTVFAVDSFNMAPNCVPFPVFRFMRPAVVVAMRVVRPKATWVSRGFSKVKLRSTGAAGANFVSPAWVATIEQSTGSAARELRSA